MSFLLIVAAAAVLIWVLAFTGAPLIAWTLLAAVALTGALYASSGLLTVVALAALLGILAFLSIVPLRRAVLSRPIFAMFRKVLPPMSSTEREAIEAGVPWWEAQMLRGRPQWHQLLDFEYTKLSAAEQSFLDNEVETACSMMNDWKAEFEDRDLPPELWRYLLEKRFFAMLITPEYGGLGFSMYAQSCVVTKLATKSVALGVTVMVPNSLGPGELLLRYGTQAQKDDWLPRLTGGGEIPCFGLTGPEAGSDATAMPDIGTVEYADYEGKRTLGIRLTFSKRWITLAPVATVIGLAFKLRDPAHLLGDAAKSDYGITCALIPASHPGIEIGRRHYPGSSFMNGPIFGKDVFIPVDWIIGGPSMAGHGWRMLVECLSAGRGISLPAMATAGAQALYRVTGAYVRIRRQFHLPIGRFEGVQEASGRIAGFCYTLEAMRVLTASAVDHCTPSVVTAIAKLHMTELLRRVINDGMDIFGGRAVQQGPRNPLAIGYRSVPIGITVEGANILTRNLMIFGQGAIRCHEFVFAEMEAARNDDLKAFDALLYRHLGSTVNRAVRAFTFGLSGSAFAASPKTGPTAPYFRQLARMSAALAFVTDMTMAVLGGELKRKERLSARLGDVLSQLYIASCVLKFFIANGEDPAEVALMRWSAEHCLAEVGSAFDGFLRNFPNRAAAALMRLVVFPLGNPYKPVPDTLNAQVAEQIMQADAVRERLTHLVYLKGGPKDPVGRIEHAFSLLQGAEQAYNKYAKLARTDELAGHGIAEQLADAQRKSLLSAQEAASVAEYDAARFEAILTDDFSAEYMQSAHAPNRAEVLDFGSRKRSA